MTKSLRTRSHNKIKLAEELIKYTWRMRLKEFFFEPYKNIDNYSQLPFFNRKQSFFMPPNGRDVYLDFYIEAISQEILHIQTNGKRHNNISKSEFASLGNLSRDDSIIIKKADKSGTIVIMTTITRHQENKLSKATSSLLPIKMIAILERTQSNVQQNIEQLQTPTMGVTINKKSTKTKPLP